MILFACTDEKPAFIKTDLEILKLRGKILSIKTEGDYSINPEMTADGRAEAMNSNVKTFNEAGFLTQIVYYDTLGTTYQENFQYDKSHRLILKLMRERDPFHFGVKSPYTNSYKYTETADHFIKEVFFEVNASTSLGNRNIYDKQGNLIMQIMLYKDGREEVTDSIYQDSLGNMVRKCFNSDRSSYNLHYQKDKFGSTVSMYEKSDLSTSRLFEQTLTYDEYGNYIHQVIRPRYDWEPLVTYSFKYRYDNKGNWIEKIIERDSSLLGKVVRTIEYY